MSRLDLKGKHNLEKSCYAYTYLIFRANALMCCCCFVDRGVAKRYEVLFSVLKHLYINAFYGMKTLRKSKQHLADYG